MSRIGKAPIQLPEKVEVTIGSGEISVKGPLGTLIRRLPPVVEVEKKDKTILLRPAGNSRHANAMSGTTRALLVFRHVLVFLEPAVDVLAPEPPLAPGLGGGKFSALCQAVHCVLAEPEVGRHLLKRHQTVNGRHNASLGDGEFCLVLRIVAD